MPRLTLIALIEALLLSLGMDPAKARELKERQTSLELHDDDLSAAHPNARSAIDLEAGTAIIRPPQTPS